jgi:STE24 endopeptidase
MRRMTGSLVLVWMILLALGAGVETRAAEAPSVARGAGAGASFDPEAATEAYLARLSPEERARSDSYFEGGYWLQLWGFLWGLGLAWLLLGTRLSARMRDAVERWTRFHFLRSILYAAGYLLLASLLSFPLDLYAGFFREHKYGLSTQSFGEWLGD